MNAERKALFLKHLAEIGIVGIAAKMASPHAKSTARCSFHNERKKDPVFAAAWEQALSDADDLILKEMKRRGIDGYEEDVYGSLGNNEGTGKVGKKRVYSDRMLELYARVQVQKVQQALSQRKVEVSGSIATTNLDLGISDLNPKQQALLQQLLDAADDPSE